MNRIILIGCIVFCMHQSHAQTNSNPVREYSSPVKTNDGWEVANAGEQDISEDSLSALLSLIQSTPPQDFRSLTIARDGKLVLDAYFNSYNRNTLHDIRSATKSITALLTGIALEQKLIEDVDVPLFRLFSDGEAYLEEEPRKARITLRDALTMRSALDADAFDVNTPGNEANWLDGQENWLDFNLRLPMTEDEPGERYVYNSTNALLAGAVIEEVSGESLRSFAEMQLFGPLGIREYYWGVGPGGHTAGMGNLYLANRDFAKIGQLILDDGRWKGQRVLPKDWAGEVAKKRVELPMPFMDTHGYGYLWYIGTKIIAGKTINYVFASGNGGNVVYVVPEYHLVVAICSSAYSTQYGNFRSNNIFEFVLRAVLSS